MGTLQFEPLIAPALWALLAVLAAAALIWYGLRRPGRIAPWRWAAVLTLMAAAPALVLLVLLNPTWVNPIPSPAGKPELIVLVDASSSMARTHTEAITRYGEASNVAAAVAARLSSRFDVRVRRFAEHAAVTTAEALPDLAPDGPLTDLAGAITFSLGQGQPQGQAVVLLSDGIHNAGGGSARVLEAVRLAKAMAAPIYTRTFGNDVEIWDLSIALRSPQDVVFIGQTVPVTVLARHQGLSGARIRLTLLHEGEEVDRQEATLAPRGDTEVRFRVKAEAGGVFHYEVRAEPLPGEATQVNNTASYLLRVVDEPIRILVLEGKPYWDTKFLNRTLASDLSVELDSVVRLAEGRYLQRTLRLARADGDGRSASDDDQGPARLETWKILNDVSDVLGDSTRLRGYQVVVLGRQAEDFLTDAALSAVRRWISQDGGALVCARGAPLAQINQRLRRVLPVRWTAARETRFRMRLTERGQAMAWLDPQRPESGGGAFARLPTLATVSEISEPKPWAVVLATSIAPSGGQERPVLTYQQYGAGRVVAIEGAGMWRWAFLPPDRQQDDQIYRGLWQSLMRWLATGNDLLPGQSLVIRSDKVVFSPNEPVTATLLLRDVAAASRVPAIELTGDTLPEARSVMPTALGDEPGTFRVAFGKLPEGRYHARALVDGEQTVTARTVFDVRSFGREQVDSKPRPDLMARIAADSDGAVLGADAPSEIAAHFRDFLARSRPERFRRTTAWDRWWVLAAVFVVWTLAWGLRRSGGLV